MSLSMANHTLFRLQEVILYRLLTGHTWLTHRYLLNRTEPDLCQTCGEILTVKHIIFHYRNFSNIKAQLEIPENLDAALNPDADKTNTI